MTRSQSAYCAKKKSVKVSLNGWKWKSRRCVHSQFQLPLHIWTFPLQPFSKCFVLVRCSVAVFPFIFFHDFLNVSFSECNYVICTPLWWCQLKHFPPLSVYNNYFLLSCFWGGIFKPSSFQQSALQHSPHTVKLVHLRRWQNGTGIDVRKWAAGKGATTARS